MTQQKTGLLLVNLGTPKAPTAEAVKQFLGDFLSDPLVVRLPRLIWLPLLKGVILPLRAKKVAGFYKNIWLQEGSPLQVITHLQKEKFVDLVKNSSYWQSRSVAVAYGMVYGSPGITEQLQNWVDRGFKQIIVLPLYPQYSTTTTEPVLQQVESFRKNAPNDTKITVVEHYFAEQTYISALRDSVQSFWRDYGQSERLLMTFHGLPQKLVDEGDPYYEHCQKTAHALAKSLNLRDQQWAIGFQSRFGFSQWLKPYSDEVIIEWARQGIKKIDVIAPSFAADCLETLQEIAVDYAKEFTQAGGKKLSLIPCLNESDKHILMMEKLFKQVLEGDD